MIKINEWVGEYYTYGRLNSQGFCMLEDIDHALKSGEWDKAKAIDYMMFNHNIQKDQATGMVEWAMSMLTMPRFVSAEDAEYDPYVKAIFNHIAKENNMKIEDLIKDFEAGRYSTSAIEQKALNDHMEQIKNDAQVKMESETSAEATESAMCECVIAGCLGECVINEGGDTLDGFATLKFRLNVDGSIVLGNTEIMDILSIDMRITDHKNNIYNAGRELQNMTRDNGGIFNITIKSKVVTEKDGE